MFAAGAQPLLVEVMCTSPALVLASSASEYDGGAEWPGSGGDGPGLALVDPEGSAVAVAAQGTEARTCARLFFALDWYWSGRSLPGFARAC